MVALRTLRLIALVGLEEPPREELLALVGPLLRPAVEAVDITCSAAGEEIISNRAKAEELVTRKTRTLVELGLRIEEDNDEDGGGNFDDERDEHGGESAPLSDGAGDDVGDLDHESDCARQGDAQHLKKHIAEGECGGGMIKIRKVPCGRGPRFPSCRRPDSS